MTAIRSDWKGRLLAGGPFLRALWLLAPVVAWAIDFSRNRHNTYKIYRYVFWHVLERRNLYVPYPGKHGDVNLYGPFFSLVIAPFALLPDALGGLLWNAVMAMSLLLAVSRLGLSLERTLLVLLVCTVEMLDAAWSNQFNTAIASLLVLTFVAVEEERDFVAPLWLLAGAFVKLYSVVGLLFFFFSRDKRSFLLGCVVWSLLLFVAPMAISSPQYVLQSYQEWFASLVHKNGLNVALYTSQDISLMGVVKRLSGLPIGSGWFLLFGVPLVLAPLLRLGQHRHKPFRLLLLASLLMFVVLFSSGSESSTYVIAASGAAIWLAQQEHPFRPRNLVILAGVLLAGLAPTDLLSTPVRHLTNHYALKAIPYAVIWFLISRDLLTRDFGPSQEQAAPVAWEERAARPAGAMGLLAS